MEPIKDWNQFLSTSKRDFNARYLEKGVNASATDFKKIRVIGSGAFGKVYLVLHRRVKKYFAMKAINKANIVRRKQIKMTLNERRIMNGVRFPFLVYMVAFAQDSRYLYFVMPFVQGGELFTHLQRTRKFDENRACFYGAQVVLALEYLHYMDILYRDLKPENILLNRDGFLKITDLGFCKISPGRTYTMCGTPEYMAPEIILNKGYGKAVDWWSFGVLLYEMCAGYPPFYHKQRMKLFEKIVEGNPGFPSHFTPELVQLVRNLLQKDPTKRFGNLFQGVNDIKDHVWFWHINWLAVVNKKVDPSYIPQIHDHSDASNFRETKSAADVPDVGSRCNSSAFEEF